MKLDKLVGERFKEKPSDCVVDSHALMVRGGYMKFVSNGIYSSFMPLRRITKKISSICRKFSDMVGTIFGNVAIYDMAGFIRK